MHEQRFRDASYRIGRKVHVVVLSMDYCTSPQHSSVEDCRQMSKTRIMTLCVCQAESGLRKSWQVMQTGFGRRCQCQQVPGDKATAQRRWPRCFLHGAQHRVVRAIPYCCSGGLSHHMRARVGKTCLAGAFVHVCCMLTAEPRLLMPPLLVTQATCLTCCSTPCAARYDAATPYRGDEKHRAFQPTTHADGA